jgi:hypothetical protein
MIDSHARPPASRRLAGFTGRGIRNTQGQGRDYPPDWSPGGRRGFHPVYDAALEVTMCPMVHSFRADGGVAATGEA